MISALMLQCLVYVFRRLPSEGDHAMAWRIALQDARPARVIESIFDHPAASHTVESLSDTAAMSRSAFSDLFTRSFGRPPMSFVHHVPMQRAGELPHAICLSIDEVVARVGLASRSHFARSFTKHASLSPYGFRQKRV